MHTHDMRGSSSLDRMAVGRTGRVADVAGGDDTALRLLEMGITPGAQVRMVGQAPLGDPLELEVRLPAFASPHRRRAGGDRDGLIAAGADDGPKP